MYEQLPSTGLLCISHFQTCKKNYLVWPQKRQALGAAFSLFPLFKSLIGHRTNLLRSKAPAFVWQITSRVIRLPSAKIMFLFLMCLMLVRFAHNNNCNLPGSFSRSVRCVSTGSVLVGARFCSHHLIGLRWLRERGNLIAVVNLFGIRQRI